MEKKPLDIVRAQDGSLVASVEWGDKAKKARIKELAGMGVGVVGLRDVVDERSVVQSSVSWKIDFNV